MRGKGIEEHVLSADEYVGLAKEAAQKPLPRADIDVTYYLQLATQKRPLSPKHEQAVWDLFERAQASRIKRVEDAIARYRTQRTPEAKAQLTWYLQELARLKEWKRER